MTTPGTMNRLLESLHTKIEDAETDCARSEPNMTREDDNYCAGYDRGYAEALREFWHQITGDPCPVKRATSSSSPVGAAPHIECK